MNEALQLRDGRWFIGNPGPMRSPAEIKASFSQISSCWLTKLMNILQKAINGLLLRIIALVFGVQARLWKVSVFSRKEQSSK